MFREYIKSKNSKSRGKANIYDVSGDTKLFLISPLFEKTGMDIKEVIIQLQKVFPKFLYNGLDGIYVVELPDFKKRNINALYKDGAIYVTGKQDSIEDMLDDIIHEVSHHLEDTCHKLIYGDGKIEKEFLTKRSEFWDRLGSSKPNNKKLLYHLLSPDFSEDLDYFFQELGYDVIESITKDMFCSGYGITSLREYWANSFENFFLKDKDRAQNICPEVCVKIEELVDFLK